MKCMTNRPSASRRFAEYAILLAAWFLTLTASAQPITSADNNLDFRLYASRALEMLNHLAANPKVQSEHYTNVTVHCLVQNFSDGQLSALDACIAQAQSISMPIYPGARVFASNQISDWVNEAHWTDMAAKFGQLASRRVNGDRRIGVDAENYLTDVEPTIESLNAAGYTLTQFRQAVKPFLNKLGDVDAVVCVYPQVASSEGVKLNQFIVVLLDVLGPERVQVWWEDEFSLAEDKRLTPLTRFQSKVTKMRRNEAEFERAYGKRGLVHRHGVDDDILRVWGAPMRTDLDTFGTVRPWIFDRTRIDHAENGTSSFINGTSIKSINDAQYTWAFAPLSTSHIDSVGIASTSLKLRSNRGTASAVAVGPALVPDSQGMRLKPNEAGYTFAVMRAETAFPDGLKTWMIDYTFQIPASVTSDVPIVSQAQYNSRVWQVYFDNTNNKLVLQIDKPSSPPVTYDVVQNVVRDSDIRIQIGRNGNAWLYGAQSDPIHHVDVGFDAATMKRIVVGGGLTPAMFQQNNTQMSCIGLLLRGQLTIWHRVLSDDEIAQVRAGQYPWGRGT